MFYIAFSIQNPILLKAPEKNVDLWVFEKRTWIPNMALDCQASLFSAEYLFSFTLDTEMVRRDHGGIRLQLQILWLFLNFDLHDTRHWNDKANRYYTPGEEAAEEAEYEQQQIDAHNAEVEALLEGSLIPPPLNAVEMVAAFSNPPGDMTGLKIKRVSKFEADEKALAEGMGQTYVSPHDDAAMASLALELDKDFSVVFGEHDILADLVARRTRK